MPPASSRVRPAVVADVPVILQLVRELAEYEKALHEVDATLEQLEQALFPDGHEPAAFAHVAEVDGEVVGCAIWFLSFSTWTGTHGIWLEDLYVTPAQRGSGLGQELLRTLADICVERGYHRLEWWVLDWNTPSIGFYESIGAVAQDEWTRFRLDGNALDAVAGGGAGVGQTRMPVAHHVKHPDSLHHRVASEHSTSPSASERSEMRARFAAFVLRATGWTAVGEVPRTGILVGAPHTSNWDFIMMLLIMWRGGVSPRVLIKQEIFRGPLGWLLPRLGGIPLDRSSPGAVIRQLVAQARTGEPFLLILAAEGTRSKGEYWKSGFWRIARSTGLPISLAFVDGPSKTSGFGPTFKPTNDVVADMDFVREFYADKRGIHPERRTEPRLREELTAGEAS